MIKKLTVSIITPSFNREEFIGETARSIFSQDDKNWEWIIVDDGSTDNTLEVAESFARKDSRVKVMKRGRQPKGACTCRNIGTDAAKGKYVIYLDTDDLLEPFCVRQRAEAMERFPELDFGIFPTLIFKDVPYDLNRVWNIDKETPDLLRQFYQDGSSQGTGILIKKETMQRIGGWGEDIRMWQDVDLFLRLHILDLPYKKFFELPPDMHHRVNDASMSRGDYFAPEKLDARRRVYKNAILLLEEHGKEKLLPEAKYLAATVINDFAKRRLFEEATVLIDWTTEHAVFTKPEAAKWKRLIRHIKFRLYKIPSLKKKMEDSLKSFRKESTIGKIPFKETFKV